VRQMIIAALAVGLSSAAAAQEPGATDAEAENATDIVETLVEDTHEDAFGRVQPSSGGAKPVETWMACRDVEDKTDDCQPEQAADAGAD
jgi:hypothetical protein